MGYPDPGDFDDPLPPELEDPLRAEVDPGETLLWAGRPRGYRYLLMSLPLVAFGVPWTTFAVFWVVMASGAATIQPVGFLFPLFGVPFILIGIGILSSPFWLARKGRRTVYGVTDRRVVLLESRLLGGVEAISLSGDELLPIRRIQRADGSGDLGFGKTPVFNQGQPVRATPTRQFLGIRQVREVESLIRRALLARADEAG